MQLKHSLIALVLSASFALPGIKADTVISDRRGETSVTIRTVRDGKLVYDNNGERTTKLANVKLVLITKMVDFNAAEKAYANGKTKEAAELYAKAIPGMGTLAVVGYARAIRAFDASGRYTDAIRSLMMVLDANPDVWVFTLKPTMLPDARSRSLTEAAEILTAKMADRRFKADEVQKEFRTMLLEIYTQAGNTKKAAEMTKALATAEAAATANTNTTTAPAANEYKYHALRMAVNNLITDINNADTTPAEGRHAMPNITDINKAAKDIQDVYANELSKTDTQEILSLTQVLTNAAMAAGNTDAQVYALFFEAARQSARGGNYDHVNKVLLTLIAKFTISPLALLTAFTQELQNQSAVGNDLIYVGWMNYGLLYQAWTVSNYEIIAQQATLLEKLQGQINDEVLKGQIGRNLPKVQAGLNAWQLTTKDREQLKTEPNNLNANLAMTKYYFYQINRVDLALPYMAKSGDIELVKLAEIERNAEAQVKALSQLPKKPESIEIFSFAPVPITVRPYLACADAWWEYGAKATPEIKQFAWTRAAFFYEKISQAELGLDSAKAKKKHSEIREVCEQEGWKKNDKTSLDPIMGNRIFNPIKFCRVECEGTRIVYILDHSGSMVDNYDFLKQETLHSLKMFVPTQSFAVILFSEGDATILGPATLQEATLENKIETKDKIIRSRAAGFNDNQLDPFEDAFRKAFAMKPDTIYFLTDGAFDPKLAVVIQALNKDKKVTINTLAFIREDPQYNERLRKLAADNKGQYRLVKLKDLN